MNAELAEVAVTFGRVLVGGVFVYGAVEHFPALRPLTEMMRKRGVPMPLTVLVGGSLLQIGLGLALIAGVLVPWASLGLVVFTIAATIMFLNFWDMEGGARVGAKNTFVVNVALVGGLLVLAGMGQPTG